MPHCSVFNACLVIHACKVVCVGIVLRFCPGMHVDWIVLEALGTICLRQRFGNNLSYAASLGRFVPGALLERFVSTYVLGGICPNHYGRSLGFVRRPLDVPPKREIGFVSFVRASEAVCLRERDYASLRWPCNSRILLRLRSVSSE